MKTPLRSIRVPQELWDSATVVAAERGMSLSVVIRHYLQELTESNQVSESSIRVTPPLDDQGLNGA